MSRVEWLLITLIGLLIFMGLVGLTTFRIYEGSTVEPAVKIISIDEWPYLKEVNK